MLRKRVDVGSICEELQRLQRHRAWHMKSRIMNANRLQSKVAGMLFGYHSGQPEKERRSAFEKASDAIEQIMAGELSTDIDDLVRTGKLAIDAFDRAKKELEKVMLTYAKKLPVAEWVLEPEQKGFGLPMMSVMIGETGDLANYANPAKVWRRLGCAPWSFDGKTLMGATWRSGKDGKLPSSEWEAYGYSPRRRSIAFNIGEGLIKHNRDGPYKTRYSEAKVRFAGNHPDYKPMRCHLHGMLLATKLLQKNLWIEWNGGDGRTPP